MAAQPTKSNSLTDKIATAQTELLDQFPQYSDQLSSILHKRFSATSDDHKSRSEEPELVQQQSSQPTITITRRPTNSSNEEINSVLQKVRQISQLPGETIEEESILYLEQQLADILGFELATSVGPVTLPFINATVASLPHLTFSPTNQGQQKSAAVPEAGTSRLRSFFGWQLGQEHSQTTDYWISLPIDDFLSQGVVRNQARQILTDKQVMMINPNESCYAVVNIVDDYRDVSNKHQFGASPRVIREGMFWSPKNAGKSLLFFIPHTEAVELGVYQF